MEWKGNRIRVSSSLKEEGKEIVVVSKEKISKKSGKYGYVSSLLLHACASSCSSIFLLLCITLRLEKSCGRYIGKERNRSLNGVGVATRLCFFLFASLLLASLYHHGMRPLFLSLASLFFFLLSGFRCFLFLLLYTCSSLLLLPLF